MTEPHSLFPEFTMAFQPIVDVVRRETFAYEALVRGLQGEGALDVLGRVGPDERYAFHEACRTRAIEMAAALGMDTRLSLNVTPDDLSGQAECFRTAMRVASACGFPVKWLMFEITGGERVADLPGLAAAFRTFKRYGFTSTLDDHDTGFVPFELLSSFQPDVVKIDMSVVRDIQQKPVQLDNVKDFVATCDELGIRVIAEGVETAEELTALRKLGVTLFQGYLFAEPATGRLPVVDWDAV
ncbi:EAL domain-containing protein [Variovorax sp. PAMC 28711]|uniref:EAL domain-containing protein n=1 Tax=Variovorax sp. PAMC 28711 TaxID=1795631 RepID=UPI00078D0825|nr:EAL domain-containing protein [Variovorax sp. PAMC 28711]AMM25027.1 diguanylate phosphodiesterase [Variovorax sp. PAMC 28711]